MRSIGLQFCKGFYEGYVRVLLSVVLKGLSK